MKQSSSRPSSTSPSQAPTADYTSAFSEDDEQTDVNAVRFQRQQHSSQARPQPRGRQQSRGGEQQRSSSRYNNNSRGRFNNNNRNESRYPSGSSNNNNNSPKGGLCSFHVSYGDKARSCKEHCLMWSQHQAKGQASQ